MRKRAMTDRIKLIDTEILSHDWGRLTRVTLDYRRADGRVQRLVRENYDHGNAAAILLVDPARSSVLLVRQFRYPVLANADPAFLLEACAGLLDDDNPLTCASREAIEETGHAPRNIRRICDIYPSPGSLQEKVTLFIGDYNAETRQATGGGLFHEGEDIELVELPLDNALAMIGTGEIVDAKTIILLQHLALERR